MDTKNRGFIGIIILILAALVAAKYFFNWSLFDWVSSDKGREAVAYFWSLLHSLQGLVLKLWAYIH